MVKPRGGMRCGEAEECCELGCGEAEKWGEVNWGDMW